MLLLALQSSLQAGIVVLAVRTNSGQYILGISVVYHSAKVPYVIMNWGGGSCAAGRELLPPQPLSQFTASSLWRLKAAQDRAQQGVNHKTNLGKQTQSMGCTVHSVCTCFQNSSPFFGVNRWTLHYNFKEISKSIFSWNFTSFSCRFKI